MFELFTDRSRRTVVLAQEEARLLGHRHISTEHILLGLVAEGESLAAQALTAAGVALPALREKTNEIVGPVDGAVPSGHIPFTPGAKAVIEMSRRESLQLGHGYIAPEHMLLALIRYGYGAGDDVAYPDGTVPGGRKDVGFGVLAVGMNVNAGQLRRDLIALITGADQPARKVAPMTMIPGDLTPEALRAEADRREAAGAVPPPPVRFDYSRGELIAICERAAAVPYTDWCNRDSARATIQLGEAWALLKAGCDFEVIRKAGHLETDRRTIWVSFTYPGFNAFEMGLAESEGYWDDDSRYLPTPERLDEMAGKDWY